jgi:lysophospholipid acyltransferase (LPLAT)-like uncharacterized protein
MRQLWRKIRNQITRQAWFRGLLANVIWLALRFVHRTNPLLPETIEVYKLIDSSKPVIFAMWHGQHVLTPFAAPNGLKMTAMFSRSGDAEINARVVEKLGIEIIRGSGGRDKVQRADKGGAQALILLKKALARGRSAVMIADISKGSARIAGEGVILLARISGRPILPVAYASSRAVTFRKSWDKTRMAMPFGRAVLCAGEPLFVTADAGPEEIEKARGELTLRLNGATERAFALVGAKP